MNGKQRKILHLITGLGVGGAEKTLLDILPLMNDANISNIVFCIRGRGAVGAALQKKGIAVSYLDFDRWYQLPRAAVHFFFALRKNPPDVLVTYLIHADLFGRVIGRIAGIKKVISYKHGALLQWEFLKYVDAMTSSLVTRYLTVSTSLVKKLAGELRIPAKKIQLLQNGIFVERYADKADSEAMAHTLRINDGTLVIGIIANLRKGKGHSDLLHAFGAVTKELPRLLLKLLIVGDGEERATLVMLTRHLGLERHVIFAGYQTNIPAVLHCIDIFVLPTYFEGMSIALLEAMAARRAIISTNIPENEAILTHGRSALLVPPGDIRLLTDALKRLVESRDERERFGEQARQDCAHRFSIATTVRQYREILLTI